MFAQLYTVSTLTTCSKMFKTALQEHHKTSV